MNHPEQDIRGWFQERKRSDAARTPDFKPVWNRAESAAREVRRETAAGGWQPAAGIVLLGGLLLLAGFLAAKKEAAPPGAGVPNLELATVTHMEMPTDFLLHPPRWRERSEAPDQSQTNP